MEHVAKVEVHVLNDGEHTRGWVHTHGMDEYDLPELEMRHVPLFLVPDAYRMIREVCDYMLTAPTPVLAGQTMQLGAAVLRFVTPVPIPGEEDHYEYPCLQIVDADTVCDCCRGGA